MQGVFLTSGIPSVRGKYTVSAADAQGRSGNENDGAWRAVLTRQSVVDHASGARARASGGPGAETNAVAQAGALGRRHSRLGAHQAARRVPDRHAAVHRRIAV